MINSLPQSLIDTATQHINEALAAPAHKAMASKAANSTKNAAGLTAAEQISQHVIPAGEDRTVIPLERTFTPDANVTKHLEKHGYQVHDYEQGLVTKPDAPDRKLRIGRVLHQTNAPEHVRKAFEKDPARQGIKGDPAYVVISRRPSDVAAMSTHQNWQSCQTLGGKAKIADAHGDIVEREQKKGSHSEMVPGIVSSGAHIAYLVKHPTDVDKHYGPIARITLNPFVSSSGKHTILRPSDTYGDHWEGFHHTVNKWAETHFPATSPEYHRHSKVYQEGLHRVSSYAPEHDEYWKHIMTSDSMSEHPNPEILEHYVNETITPGNAHHQYNLSPLMNNPHLPEHLSDKLVNNYVHRKEQLNVLAKTAKNHTQLQKVIDASLGQTIIGRDLSKNPHATHQQLHDIMDMYGAGKTNEPGRRQVAHHGYSPEIIRNIVNHPNSNDSHFRKIFEMDSVHPYLPDSTHEIHDHWSALEGVARRYHSEDVGRDLVNAFKTQVYMVPHNVVHDVAEKHPQLLNEVSDRDVAEGLRRHPLNENLMKINHERNTPETLKAVAATTKDHALLDKLKQHPDQEVREHATRYKASLERAERYDAEEKAFNQGNGQ